jgi:hypothetical protein
MRGYAHPTGVSLKTATCSGSGRGYNKRTSTPGPTRNRGIASRSSATADSSSRQGAASACIVRRRVGCRCRSRTPFRTSTAVYKHRELVDGGFPDTACGSKDSGTQRVMQPADPCAALPAAAASPFRLLCRCLLCFRGSGRPPGLHGKEGVAGFESGRGLLRFSRDFTFGIVVPGQTGEHEGNIGSWGPRTPPSRLAFARLDFAREHGG